MKLVSLHEFFLEELRDLYSAENQILKALPSMAQAASAPELQAAFAEHREQTKEQVRRLDQLFDKLEAHASGKKCKAVEGLIEDSKELLEQEADPAVLDAALINAAQKVEHYEIASYGCVRTYAHLLGYEDAADLLQESLDEENATDKKLTRIAERANYQAAGIGADEGDKED